MNELIQELNRIATETNITSLMECCFCGKQSRNEYWMANHVGNHVKQATINNDWESHVNELE